MKTELYIYQTRTSDEAYLFLTDAGTKPYDHRKPYFVGGYIFTCPICDNRISSHPYLHIVSWERQIVQHLIDKHNGKELARDRIQLDLPEGFVINDKGMVDAKPGLYPGAPGPCQICAEMDGNVLCEPEFCDCPCHKQGAI